jgi:hypothetical protein
MKIKKSKLKELIRDQVEKMLNEADGNLRGLQQTGGGGVYGSSRPYRAVPSRYAHTPKHDVDMRFRIAKELGLIPDVGADSAFGWLQQPVSMPGGEEISHPGVLRVHDDPVFGTESYLMPPADPIEKPGPPPANRDSEDAYDVGKMLGKMTMSNVSPVMTTQPDPSVDVVAPAVGKELFDLADLLDFLAGEKEGERIPYQDYLDDQLKD